jgi:hypothetical protein
MINPFGAARGNTSLLVFWMLFFVFQILLATAVGFGGFSKFFGDGSHVDALGRQSLSSHMPKAMPGWHKRAYLASDGEAITQGARGNGLEARLAMGEDLEQFQLYGKAGINAAVAVYVNGDSRIAIGLMRGVMKMPPWIEQSYYSSADWAAKVAGLHEGKIVAIVQGLAFERRGATAPDGAEIGYERYVARIGHELTIDVISDAPQTDVENLLARIDGVALQSQLPEDSPAIDAELGLALYHRRETWPELLDLTGAHKLSDWVRDEK